MNIITALIRVLGFPRPCKRDENFIAEDIEDPHADELCVALGRAITWRQFNAELAEHYARERAPICRGNPDNRNAEIFLSPR